jgi:mannose/fructose/sorbose-specific phosphotransferase system IIC component
LKEGNIVEIDGIQMILIFFIACIAGVESVTEEFQVHRPLIACTLIGLVLGDLKTGIIIGGTLEMMAIGWMNIGAAIAPDTALASIISAIIVIAGNQSISAGIAIAIPIATAGQVLTIIVRTITVFFQHQADKFAREDNMTGIDFCHICAILVQGIRVAIPALIVAMFIGNDVIQHILASVPEVVNGGLKVAGGIVVVVGYAMVINMMEAKHLMPFFFLGFVVAAIAQLKLVALGVIGIVAAVFYIQLNPKYNTVVVKNGSVSSNVADDQL